MLQKILNTLDRNPSLKAETALFITFDEGGGYYDSGFIQPLDFFGDGPRIPFVVVSPYSTGGHVVHSYTDHASILKFIERNWGLLPLTGRSRDNLPNPTASPNIPTCRRTVRQSAICSTCSILLARADVRHRWRGKTALTSSVRSRCRSNVQHQPTPLEMNHANQTSG